MIDLSSIESLGGEPPSVLRKIPQDQTFYTDQNAIIPQPPRDIGEMIIIIDKVRIRLYED